MYPQYMCILLYVNLIWCNMYSRDLLLSIRRVLSIGVGLDVSSVYVNYAICESYLV